MNKVSQAEQKDSILKSLAVAGFIGIIIFIAWAAIQLVNLVPGAFSSLASLAESMDQYEKNVEFKNDNEEDLIVTSDVKLVDVNNPVNLSWSTTDVPGSYAFAYECKDGVSIDLVDGDAINSINCDTNYNIGKTNTLAIVVNSEKERYQDVHYTLSFLATDDTEPRATGRASLTVVNDEINDLVISQVIETDEVEVEETTPESVTEVPETTEAEAPATTPTYEQEFTYEIPTSDPNGRTDLATKFIALGTIVGNTFFPGEAKQNESAALQFEVKNLGTKTSTDWTYEVTLPNGTVYTSPNQEPLKPNERAVITLGFPTIDESSHIFEASIDENTDTRLTNNTFTQTVTFVE